jgi:hypothetical protein
MTYLVHKETPFAGIGTSCLIEHAKSAEHRVERAFQRCQERERTNNELKKEKKRTS